MLCVYLKVRDTSVDNQRGEHVESRTTADGPGTPGSGLTWIKSSLSFSNGNCVEVASLPDALVGVRDSKDPAGPVLRFTSGEWRAFLGGARNGEFEGFVSELSLHSARLALPPALTAVRLPAKAPPTR
jgi:hypothetical protein